MQGYQEQLRQLVITELAEQLFTQVEIARELGISEKHLSQMLTGRVRMSVEWAGKILFICGRTLTFATIPTKRL